MLVADSRHEMTPVLNELARSCAPYASAATQQGVDYGKLPCTFYIYIRQLLVLNISLTPWYSTSRPFQFEVYEAVFGEVDAGRNQI